MMEIPWMAMYVRSRAEKKARMDMEESGITCYVPLRKTLRQWSDRKKKVDMVVIPSYIFVQINPKEYMKAFASPHIVGIVRFENKPALIPHHQIIAMRRIIESDTEFEVSVENLQKGDKVKIKYGSLAGIEGEFIEIARNKRFILQIKQIGFSLSVQVPHDYLEFM
ncbi:MAG: UpxY family transcription antiterminator [Bacteroidota bacterium]